MSAALYDGLVTHKRMRPKPYALRHRLFSILLDLDRLEPDLAKVRLLSLNKCGLFSFYEKDFGDPALADISLVERVRTYLADHQLSHAGHRIELMAMPRVMGYVFNPLSVYFCYEKGGELAALLYEVGNTYRERHGYLIATPDEAAKMTHSVDKCFYVSPFQAVSGKYRFHLKGPDHAFGLTIEADDGAGGVMVATHKAERASLTDKALLKRLFTYPFMTLGIMMGIHWHALKIYLKKIPVIRRLCAYAYTVTTPKS